MNLSFRICVFACLDYQRTDYLLWLKLCIPCFLKQNLGVAYKTKNNIGRVLNTTADINKRPKYLNSGLYQLHCQNFPLVYTRQTGRKFQVMVEEYALAYKNNYSRWSYAQHLINHGKSLVHMYEVMGEIFTTHKGRRLDMFERYHIQNVPGGMCQTWGGCFLC